MCIDNKSQEQFPLSVHRYVNFAYFRTLRKNSSIIFSFFFNSPLLLLCCIIAITKLDNLISNIIYLVLIDFYFLEHN